MNIFEKLTKEDKEKIATWINLYAGGESEVTEGDLGHILRHWAREKEDLYHLFGDKFIIEKEIDYEKDQSQIYSELYGIIHNSNKCPDFYNRFWNAISKIEDIYYGTGVNRRFNDNVANFRRLFNIETLSKNSFNFETCELPIGEKIIRIQHGAKPMRFLQKIFKAYGYEEIFEELRLKHSMVFNEKRFKGTLCLSIHPLDYMTMSDNECNWESCMNWRDQGGYRRGTVEMMNSSMAVVAYLKSSTSMNFGYNTLGLYEWNSKKWRELILFNDEKFICGVKGYPIWNKSLEKIAVNWLRELSLDRTNWGGIRTIYPWTDSDYEGYKVHMEPEADAMYNDFNEEVGHQACFNLNVFAEYGFANYDFNYSGEASCMKCGGHVYLEDSNESILVCEDCNDETRCEYCEEFVPEEDLYEIDGCHICEYCYDNHVSEDDLTGENHLDSNMNKIYIHNNDRDKFHINCIYTYYGEEIENLKEAFGEEINLYEMKYDLEPYLWTDWRKMIEYTELSQENKERLAEILDIYSDDFEDGFMNILNAVNVKITKLN